MIATRNKLIRCKPVTPFCERTKAFGMTYGLGPAGYDVRIAETLVLLPGDFALASTMERFHMPRDLLGVVHDKSTWARLGLACQNTVIEPGWEGFLTLELTNHSNAIIDIWAGMPICQIIFHRLDETIRAEDAYNGKYQGQERGPQEARFDPS